MKISGPDPQKFIAIYQEEFGETLSLAEASDVAFRLVSLYTQLTKALPSERRANAQYNQVKGFKHLSELLQRASLNHLQEK